jgi:hypothetical protein
LQLHCIPYQARQLCHSMHILCRSDIQTDDAASRTFGLRRCAARCPLPCFDASPAGGKSSASLLR